MNDIDIYRGAGRKAMTCFSVSRGSWSWMSHSSSKNESESLDEEDSRMTGSCGVMAARRLEGLSAVVQVIRIGPPRALCGDRHCFRTKRAWLSQGGGIGRMLDMGGAPSALNDAKSPARLLNASKNCRAQAVCFDFDLLTRSCTQPSPTTLGVPTSLSSTAIIKGDRAEVPPIVENPPPKLAIVQQVASLLKVDWSHESTPSSKISRENDKSRDEDLSLLTGDKESPSDEATATTTTTGIPSPPDIRTKYAAKLSQKGVSGGLAAVDLMKLEKQQAQQHGSDVAAGRLEARQRVAREGPATSWMALTGTGTLLQYLTQRSLRIVLLPTLTAHLDEQVGRRMDDLQKQLPDVVFHVLIKDGARPAEAVVQEALQQLLPMEATRVLVVSDRDAYLRAARDAGAITCRIRPENAPRGNVSAHYLAASVPEVQEVLNEINGISFNAVLQQGR